MVVGHRAQRAPGAGLLEEQAERAHQQRGDAGGVDVLQVDEHAAGEGALHEEDRVLGHAHVDGVDVRAEQGLAQAVEEVGDAQGGHEQRHALLVDQVAQHEALDQPGHHPHQRGGQHEGDGVGQHEAFDADPLRHPGREARHCQRGEQHHRALREVEHPRGLEDQHEAQRHQGVQHAGHEAAEERFEEEGHGYICSISGSCRGRRG